MVGRYQTMKGDKVKRDSSREWKRQACTTCQGNQNQARIKADACIIVDEARLFCLRISCLIERTNDIDGGKRNGPRQREKTKSILI